MATTGATVAESITGIPEVSPEVSLKIKQEIVLRRRVLIGWNHQNDTEVDLLHGKLWCWVTRHNHLMVFDAMFNRPLKPGEVRFCGVANFTMVRMFHPYWCSAGRVPRDMVSSDKERCRLLYAQRIRQFRIQYGMAVSPEPQAAAQVAAPNDVETTDTSDEENLQYEMPRRGRGRGQGRGRGRAPCRGARRRAAEPVTGREENVPGLIHNDPMEVSDECDDTNDNDENDGSNDTDMDMDIYSITDNELELDNLWAQVERHASHKIREDSTDSISRGSNSNQDKKPKLEEMDGENDIELADQTQQEPKNNHSVIKAEENHRSSGERDNPIIVVDDDDNDHDDNPNDDASMFFPENPESNSNLNPDPSPNANRSPTRDLNGHAIDSMMDGATLVEQDVKEERELKTIEVARTMEGPRELIVIDDD